MVKSPPKRLVQAGDLRRYVALLRGVNVGGKNRVAMADLAASVEAAGGTQVRTYIQSGNAVFAADARSAMDLAGAIERGLRERCGVTAPVVLRTAEEMAAVAAGNPFLAEEGAAMETLHVGFMAMRPRKDSAAALDPDRSPGDRFVVRGGALYLHLPSGVARTKLTTAYLDTTLGTTVTIRNWRTVLKLAEMVRDGAADAKGAVAG